MRKSFVTTIASLAMWAMLPLSAANATIYNYTFVSFDGELTLTGQMTVDSFDQVTHLTGSLSGVLHQTISGVVTNPGFPNATTSSDGSFIYNNLFYSADPYFDNDGLLITTIENTTGYWNIWGNSPGNYSLWESVGAGDYAIEETGLLTVFAAPELSTWGMLLAGFAGLSVAARRRGSHPAAINFG